MAATAYHCRAVPAFPSPARLPLNERIYKFLEQVCPEPRYKVLQRLNLRTKSPYYMPSPDVMEYGKWVEADERLSRKQLRYSWRKCFPSRKRLLQSDRLFRLFDSGIRAGRNAAYALFRPVRPIDCYLIDLPAASQTEMQTRVVAR